MTNPTLKQQIDAGSIFYVRGEKNEHLCSIYRDGAQYILVGISGRHTLTVACTDADRLQAHWNGFSESCVVRGREQALRIARWKAEAAIG